MGPCLSPCKISPKITHENLTRAACDQGAQSKLYCRPRLSMGFEFSKCQDRYYIGNPGRMALGVLSKIEQTQCGSCDSVHCGHSQQKLGETC